MKRLLLAQCTVLWLLTCSDGEALSHTFVHLFEWTWQDIAKECEDFLGPNKYTAVQISPPNEHRVLLGRPWYERYQPVSYRLTSRSGNRAELIDMIQRCHNAGVRVYADAVINHMASCRPQCDQAQPQFGNKGSAGSSYTPGVLTFNGLFDPEDQGRIPGALNAYSPTHFHQTCTDVSNCELERLADLATERADVQATIANYLASLIAVGVDGLRIDAARHIPSAELHTILEKMAVAMNVRIEDTAINPSGAKSILVYQEFIGDPTDKNAAYANGKTTEFEYGEAESRAFLNWDGLNISKARQVIQEWTMQDSFRVVIFIDNHDKQRGHGGGGKVWAHKGGDGKNYGIRNDLQAYTLANVFMLAYPYGYPQVMASYRFGNGELWNDQYAEQDIEKINGQTVTDDFLGPPHGGSHKKELMGADYADAVNWNTQRVWASNGTGGLINTCFNPNSKWMCEHRWTPIAGMARFRAATSDQFYVSYWWDDTQNRIAFRRGTTGFVVINGELWSSVTEFGPEGNGWFPTGMAAGKYCNVIKGRLSQDKKKCISSEGTEMSPIVVFEDGKAHFSVGARDAAAIHGGEKIME
jgi:alpha-amylase